MTTPTTCPTCKTPQGIRCPCGSSGCGLITYTPFCPSCEPERATKWQKMNGIRVCAEELKRQGLL